MNGLDRAVTGWTPDVGHIINGGMDPLATMQQWQSLINHVHFKDWDGAPEFALMGAGKVDFDRRDSLAQVLELRRLDHLRRRGQSRRG